MNIKSIKFIVLILGSIMLSIFVLLNFNIIKKIYFKTFHKDGIICNFNVNGNFEGEFDIYSRGKIAQKCYYKDGLLEGWKIVYYENGDVKTKSFYKKNKIDGVEFNYYDNKKIKSEESFNNGKYEGQKITYYRNGQIEQRSFRKKNKVEGLEYAYYENGTEKYKRNWIHSKLYGDQYFYYEDHKVKIYHAYDLLGRKFYLSIYNKFGQLVRSEGNAFSDDIYSINTERDSSLLLKNSNTYYGIRDMYFTIANPPHTSTAIKVIINKKIFKDVSFLDNNNTVRINNAFPKNGIYKIILYGAFVDKSNLMTGNVAFKLTITKE